jgi:hypothetical protein
MKQFAIWNLIVNKTVAGRLGLEAVLKQWGYDIAEGTFLLLIWYHFVSSFIGTAKLQVGSEYGIHIISLRKLVECTDVWFVYDVGEYGGWYARICRPIRCIPTSVRNDYNVTFSDRYGRLMSRLLCQSS